MNSSNTPFEDDLIICFSHSNVLSAASGFPSFPTDFVISILELSDLKYR